MGELSFKIQDFEGPLDLLLHLISKHKMDIYDIEIYSLVEQYLNFIRQIQEEDLEMASSFLEMAARLVYIKTVSLLPVDKEAEDLKQELVGELLEYRDCQIMAEKLRDISAGFGRYTREPIKIEGELQYKRFHDPIEIFKAYYFAVGKGKRRLPPPVSSFSGIVSRKIVSVSSKIIFVLRNLWNREEQPFSSLIRSSENRSEMVAVFLAVLELVKAKRISLETGGQEAKLKLLKE